LRIWQNKFGHFSFVPFAHYCSILRIWQNKIWPFFLCSICSLL
jgi:hypothetical protein